MLRYRLLSIIFIVVVVPTVFLVIFQYVHFLVLIAELMIYLGTIAWGSFNINSGLYTRTLSNSNTREKIIGITFDDGPCENTLKINKILAKHDVKATFFFIGKKIGTNDHILKEIHQAGHLIGNHSYDHYNKFPLQPVKKIAKEIELTNTRIEAMIGEKPIWFRPPFGVINPMVAKAVVAFGMKIVGWSIRSFDTRIKDQDRLINRIIKGIKPGKIILLHDTTSDIDKILDQLLLEIARNGYKVKPLNELLKIDCYE